MGMASPAPSLVTPSDPDATQWQDANQQRLAAIELQREKLRDLERRARLREIEATTSRLESRRERAEELELQARRHKIHGPPQSQREMYAVRSLDQLNRDREQQRKHDEASRKRIEQRRVSERLELARKEKTSVDDRKEEMIFDGDATVARNWELWRSEQKARREKTSVDDRREEASVDDRREEPSVDGRREEPSLEEDATVARNWGLWRSEQQARRLNLQKQKIVRDRAGMGAGMRGEGARQRPVSSQQATDTHPSARRGRVGVRDWRSRYTYQVETANANNQITVRTTHPPRSLLFYDGEIPSFLRQEFEYMGRVSSTFPEVITPSIQMSCMKSYQRATAHASVRLPCGICGGLFQEDCTTSMSLEDEHLLHYLQASQTSPDSCAVTDNRLSVCQTCDSCIAKRKIPPWSAGNFVNRLFRQDYPAALRDLNTVEECFIARAHVIGAFLKLTSGAHKGIGYRGARGHYVAVKQDPSNILTILPTKRLQDHTTISAGLTSCSGILFANSVINFLSVILSPRRLPSDFQVHFTLVSRLAAWHIMFV
ncbi:hypothetical protein BKA64DRAFT_765884 [Cadophora sp. MPI-SDFR-AT-0126]|nr:hypothetical protein BKA64DRAFT_765884 [Leotiomycetes sp. MPI-SDFR-AT-0126]